MATTLTAGAGAGTGATATLINADDDGGIISILAGVAPTALAIVATLTYDQPYDKAPQQVQITPANQFAAELGVGWCWAPDTLLTADKFDVKAPTVPLVAGITYKWYYRVLF